MSAAVYFCNAAQLYHTHRLRKGHIMVVLDRSLIFFNLDWFYSANGRRGTKSRFIRTVQVTDNDNFLKQQAIR
jgi:hypothetical protein